MVTKKMVFIIWFIVLTFMVFEKIMKTARNFGKKLMILVKNEESCVIDHRNFDIAKLLIQRGCELDLATNTLYIRKQFGCPNETLLLWNVPLSVREVSSTNEHWVYVVILACTTRETPTVVLVGWLLFTTELLISYS